MSPEFRAGQCWTYRAPEGFSSSRIVIGAVLAFSGSAPIMCCMVSDAPLRMPDGSLGRATIPFLPLTSAALEETVLELDGEAQVDNAFIDAYAAWRADERGLRVFSVPFGGFLDQLVARQMASIIGVEV
ncbi:MAG: hypothetical protein F9K44_11410 [Hyphomicrobiaceae bacterium]|nr:MAG: hypothetical protein F9K44_11410 [Hyphomicrobiaceae bacterium]